MPVNRYDTVITDELEILDNKILMFIRVVFCFEPNETTLINPAQLEQLDKIFKPAGNQKIKILSIKGTCSAAELGLPPSTTNFSSLPGPLNLTKANERAGWCYDRITALKNNPAYGQKLDLLPKNSCIKIFKPEDLAILQLGEGGLNGYRTRSVEIRFSKVITLPVGTGAQSSTQFRLNIGDDTPGLHSLIPFTTFSEATLTMEADGNTGTPTNNPTQEYDVTTFAFGIGVGVGQIAKACKNLKKSQEILKTATPGIFERIITEADIVDDVISTTATNSIRRAVFDTVKDLLVAELSGIASFELDTNTPDPVFFTAVPYSFNDLDEFCIVALEGSVAVPMLSHNFSLAFTVGFALLPLTPFVDISVSLGLGPSLDVAEIELKIIKLTKKP